MLGVLFLGFLVGNFDAEFLFKRHDQLDGVERIGAEVVNERCIRSHFFFVDAQLLHDNALHLVGNGHESLPHMYIPPLTART